MKIAVNRCFGGFGLSEKAYKRLIELGVKYYKSFDDHSKSKNHDEIYIIFNDKDSLQTLFKYASNLRDYENRTNKLLIQVIEELGDEASGRCGNLEVIEIPDDISYEIDDYDGVETIRELHRSW